MTHPIRPRRGLKAICIACSAREYDQAVDDPREFRALLDRHIRAAPELLPPLIRRGYRMKAVYSSREMTCQPRRIELRNLDCYPTRPSSLMPYLAGRTERVRAPLSSAGSPSPAGRQPRSSVAAPCTGTARDARWAASASWAPPSPRRGRPPPPRRRRAAHDIRRREGLPGGYRRRGPPARFGPGPGPWRRRVGGGLPDLPRRGPVPRPLVPPRDGRHRRPGGDAGRLAGVVSRGGVGPPLPPCVPEDPGPGRAPGCHPRRLARAGLGGVSRRIRRIALATPASAAGAGRGPCGQGGRARRGVGVVFREGGVRGGVFSSGLPSHERPGGPVPASPRPPALLCPALARLGAGERARAARLGVDSRLRPVVPLDQPPAERQAFAARPNGSTASAITPSGCRTSWSRRLSPGIGPSPEKT